MVTLLYQVHYVVDVQNERIKSYTSSSSSHAPTHLGGNRISKKNSAVLFSVSYHNKVSRDTQMALSLLS